MKISERSRHRFKPKFPRIKLLLMKQLYLMNRKAA